MNFFKSGYAVLLLCVLLVCAGGCARPKAVTKAQPETAKPLAAGKHILLIVPQSDFSDQDYEKLHTIFTTEGAATLLASPRDTAVSSIKGLILPTDVSLELADITAYDAVIFIGGKGASSLFENKDAFRLAREAAEQGKILGACDTATLILGLAGVLEGKTATAPPRLAKSYIEISKCIYSEKPVVTDANIITSASEADSESLAREVVELLQ